jgi:hypothetical protein
MSNKCNKNCASHDIKLKGPRGFRGEAGPTGSQGPAGPQGIQGTSGPSNPANIDIVAINDITVTSNTVGDLTTYTVGRTIIDTGWVDLEGFAYYQGTMANQKPQVRRMGNQIHFRGDLIIPIADGAGASVPLTTEDTVRNTFRKDVEVSTGNTFISNAEIFFNSTGAAGGVVIPSSVLDVSTNLDNTYTLNNQIATRQTILEYSNPLNTNPGTALLSSTFQVSITNTKQLKITSLESQEQNTADSQSMQGASPLNKLNSRFQIRFPAVNNNGFYDGSSQVGDTNPDAVSTSIGDPLTVGQYYTIVNLAAGDDFTNVGFNFTQGVTFQATGTTPTTWVASEIQVATIGQRQSLMPQSFNGINYAGILYPFMLDAGAGSVNASLANDLGGFKIRLDGLIAYLAIATP